MTLNQWSEQNSTLIHQTPKGLKYVIVVYMEREAEVELFHLDDYFVSTVSAGSAFLIPKWTIN